MFIEITMRLSQAPELGKLLHNVFYKHYAPTAPPTTDTTIEFPFVLVGLEQALQLALILPVYTRSLCLASARSAT